MHFLTAFPSAPLRLRVKQIEESHNTFLMILDVNL